jgi:hypothetical protein
VFGEFENFDRSLSIANASSESMPFAGRIMGALNGADAKGRVALLTVVFGYVGGAALPVDSRKVDRSKSIVAESGDFPERSDSSLNSKALRI